MGKRAPSPAEREAAEMATDAAHNPNSELNRKKIEEEIRDRVEKVSPGLIEKFGLVTTHAEQEGSDVPAMEHLIFRGIEPLAMILRGVKGADGVHLVPRCKVTLLLDGDTPKIAVQDASAQRTAYKTLDPDRTLPDAILDALDGPFQWVPWNAGRPKK